MAKSLAAEKGLVTLPENLNLPSVFQAPAPDIKGRFTSPYVMFGHPMAKEVWPKVLMRYNDAQEGQQFLMGSFDKGADGKWTHVSTIERLQPFKYSIVTARQYWSRGDNTGAVLETSLTEKPFPFKEIVEGVILVYLGDKLIPATCQFRSTKTGGIKPMTAALLEAEDAAKWSAKGEAYKLSLVASKPFMRFYGTVSLGNAKTSKRSGNPYIPASCMVHATTAVEWKMLGEHFSDLSWIEGPVTEVSKAFERRIDEVASMAAKKS